MLPKLKIFIDVDTAQMKAGLARAKRSMGKFAKSAATVAVAASAAYLSVGLKLAGDLDKALAETSTLLGGATDDMDQLKAAAFDLSATFGGGPTRQVEAFYQAISAGAGDVTQATELLETANLLAKGGVTDITTAVDVLTTATNAYAESGLTAAEAADFLFTGVKDGKTTVSELANSLGNVVPIAASVGVGFDEIVAATSALTSQGQSTSMAVTGIRQTLASVLKPTKEAADLAASLGLEFDAAALSSKGLSAFLVDVADKTGGSQEEIAQLFGSVEALNAVLAFTGGAGDTFAKSMENMASSVGATQEAADVIAGSLSDRLNVQMGLWGDTSIRVGELLLKVLVPALEGLTAEFGRTAEAIKYIIKATKDMAQDIKDKIDWMMSEFNKLLEFFASLPEKMKEIGANIVKGLIDGITSKWQAMKSKISEMADALPGWMKKALDIRSPSKVFAEIGENIVDGLIVGMVGKTKNVTDALDGIAETIGSTFGSGLEAVITKTKTVAEAFRDMATDIIKELYRVLVVQNIVAGAKALIGGLSGGGFNPFAGGFAPAGGFSARAGGGPVSPRTPYLVGERGPEIIVPNGGGTVIPNSQIGGGVTQNITINAMSDGDIDRVLSRRMPQLKNMVLAAVGNKAVRT